jgi:hypothetical protein
MLGRKCPRPLALLLFSWLALNFLYGQAASTSRITPTPDFQTLPLQPPPRPIPPPPQVTASTGLTQLTRAAGSIFSGTVTSIARSPASNAGTIETVSVTFHVENAIRGATPGADFTLRQWIGLWLAGQRYQVGERVLLFLYPLSKLGLTSCVAAPIGRFRIDASGRIFLTAQQIAALRADPVVGGKSRISFADFALAVQQASPEASQEE